MSLLSDYHISHIISVFCILFLYKAKQELIMASIEGELNESVNEAVQAVESLKTIVKGFSDDFPSPDGLLEEFKDFMEKATTFLDREMRKSGAQLEQLYKEIRKTKAYIKFHEGNQAEL